jgi:predicted RND superfamily exporter protein
MTFNERFARAVIRHKWLIIVLTLVLTVLAGVGAKKLTMSGDYRIFFKEDNAQLLAFNHLQTSYSKNENVLLVLEPRDGEVFTPKNLDALVWLTKEGWQLPYSTRVDSVSNYQYSTAEGDTLTVHDLVREPLKLTEAEIARIKDIATHDPLIAKRLVSPTGHTTAVNVTFALPGKDKIKEIQTVMLKTRDLIKAFEARYPQYKVHLTGIVPMNAAFSEATRDDMRTLMPIMMAVVIAVLLLTLRSGYGTALIMVAVIFSVAITMGLAGWGGVVLSAPLATVPLTVLIMAIADGVHILSHYGHGLRSGLDKTAAMQESISANLTPMMWTNVLSAIGYMTMLFSAVPPFQVMGILVSIGILVAFLICVTFLPAVMLLLPGKVHSREDQKITLMDRYKVFFLKHRNRMLAGSAIVTLVFGSFIFKNQFDDSFVEYFDKSTEFRQATDYTLENLTGVYMMDYSLAGQGEGGINEPAYLQKVDEFAGWLRTQPEVLHVNTFTEVMKRLNRNMHGDDPAFQKLPESRELGAQYVLLYELSLPYGLDLTNQVNLDHSATRITVTLKNISSAQMLNFEARAADWLKANQGTAMSTPGAAGAGLIFAYVGQQNGKSMLTGNVWQIVLISFLIILILRSFKLGIISLIPNLAPAVVAYGVWGLLVGEINMAVSLVGAISMGIVVDDTIHFMTKYLHARRDLGMDPEASVGYAFDIAGVPMWISTFILVAGFLVLASSDFLMNSDLGKVTAMTIGLAALTEAFMLPGLILLVDRKKTV